VSRVIGAGDLNRSYERCTLDLSGRAVDQINDWRLDAISALALNDDPEPITSLTNCLVSLLRFGGKGYAESDNLVVVNTARPDGLEVGMYRDPKGVCSLNS